MEVNDIYIHYGHPKYDEKVFTEIRNAGFVKPYGGLWASNINAEFGWKNWCEEEDFSECIEENSFKFKLKENARILRIDDAAKLKELPTINSIYKFSWINLDFEKIKKEYDAIEVIISEDRQLYWDLYGWDCDSLLVMNKEVIEPIES